MQVTVRTATGKIYKFDVEDTMTVKQIKEIFAQQSGSGDSPVKLIHKGKILADDLVFNTLNFQANSFFVAQVSRPKPAPAAAPAPAPAPAAPATPTSTPATGAAPATGNAAAAPSTVIPPTPSGPSAEPLPTLSSGGGQAPARPSIDEIAQTPQFADGIQQLMGMGFGRTDSEAALRAAMGNPDVAAEFLLSGHIPSEEEVQRAQREEEQQTQQITALLQSQPENLGRIISLFEQQNPQVGAQFRAHPEILLQRFGLDPAQFDLEAVRNGQGRGESLGPPAGDPYAQDPYAQPAPGPYGGQQPMGAAPGVGAGAGAEPVQTGPTMSSFQGMMSQFSPEEQASVRRLQELGFDLPTVIQAYIACDKDENLAANLLFSYTD